jgi:hypothetical protein
MGPEMVRSMLFTYLIQRTEKKDHSKEPFLYRNLRLGTRLLLGTKGKTAPSGVTFPLFSVTRRKEEQDVRDPALQRRPLARDASGRSQAERCGLVD